MANFIPVSELNRAQKKIANAKGRQRAEKLTIEENNGVTSNILQQTLSDVSEEILIRRLDAAVTHMTQDDYFKSFGHVLDEALDESELLFDVIICYGLGSFGSSMISRYQLAFLVLLQEKLKAPVEIYDPAFTPNEIGVLTSKLGFHVLTENEEGNRYVENNQTLFYMPHTPHQLVNNLIYTNWFPTAITKCICICNSFANLKSNFPKRILRHNLEYIHRSEQIVVEYGIINTFMFKDIFNDMAIHTFPWKRIKDLYLPLEYWEKSVKPVYRQTEYVQVETGIDET